MITGKQLRDCFISAANSIANNKNAVDELNVFPVPDGDTGTNMSMTFGNALGELEALPDSCTVDTVSTITASALLRGARGNSGVILSLLFRGFGRAMANKKEADSADLAFALAKGVEYAYRAVMKPTEGTILTVARVAAQAAKDNAPNLTPVELWQLITDTANETLLTTPELLPILKKAGVVDAGGKGFCVISEAMLHTLKTGEVIMPSQPSETAKPTKTGVFADDLNPELINAYCTEFLVIKNENANYEKLRAVLESIGDSVVCVDDKDIIKCHVHTAQPNRALAEALRHGHLSKIKIENMAEQYAERQAQAEEQGAAAEQKAQFEYVENTEDADYAFVAVGAGEGISRMFSELGAARVVSGGQTMNPSTEDIINAVQSLSAKTIYILANNKNIILAAEQATKLCDRPALVVPTRYISEGVSAMLAFDETLDPQRNMENMKQAIAGVTTGEITFASRDSEFDGKNIKENDILALIGGKLTFTGKDADATAVKLCKQMSSPDKSFFTIYFGQGVTAEQAEKVAEQARRALPADTEVTTVDGGMPVYYYCISAE